MVATYRQSSQLEVQTRSVEYSRLLAFPAIGPQVGRAWAGRAARHMHTRGGKCANAARPAAQPVGSTSAYPRCPACPLRRCQVLEHIPPVEESAYDASLEPSEAAAAAAAQAASSASAAADLAALLGLDAGLGGLDAGPGPVAGVPAAPPAAASGQPSAVNALSDLLAGDLLGSGGSTAAPAAASMPASATAAVDPLAGLFGAPVAPAPAAPEPAGPTITAFQKGALTVTFQLSKGATPADTDILASFSNSAPTPLEGFTLQAAVPKQMQLKLDPASSGVVPPGSAGTVTQRLHVHNTMHGQKALVMRLRISYSQGGQAVLEQGEVANFPPGF